MSLRQLYEQYHESVQFLMIYLREVHPKDGWWFGEGISKLVVQRFYPKAALDLYDPRSLEERRGAALQCETALQYGIKTYVDDMDDTVGKAYAARPTRLYLVGIDGKVVYGGGLGPRGFKPSELKEAIEGYLATSSPTDL